MLNFIKNIGPTEWIVIALILIVFLGPRLIKKMARTSGESLKEIKNIKNSIDDVVEDVKKGD